MDPKITQGFHHITMVSTQAPRTLAFYRELLGLPLVKMTVNFDDPTAYHLYFGDSAGTPGTILTFFEWPNSPRGSSGIGGVHHLALSVKTAEAQLMWKRRLADAGIRVFKYYLGRYKKVVPTLSAYNSDHPRAATGYAHAVLGARRKIKKRYTELYKSFQEKDRMAFVPSMY